VHVPSKAIAAGYKDVANIKGDGYFDSLRKREDFRKLVAELDADGIPRRK
jgi:hypothetical protein